MKNLSKILCLGLSKTGSTSINNALQILGYNSKHYYFSPVEKIYKQNFTIDDFNKIDAYTDISVLYCYKELSRLFPNSKYIILTRPLESWLESCKYAFPYEIMKKYEGTYEEKIFMYIYGCAYYNKDAFIKAYHYWYDILYGIFKEGNNVLYMDIFYDKNKWKKLCNFLNKEIPNIKFPDKNKGNYHDE